MGTMDTLVDDLREKPETPERDAMIRKALAGYYHDFKSELGMPKVALVGDLSHYGYRDLARRARAGDYDDKPDDADDEDQRAWLATQPHLAEVDRKLRAGEITYEEAVLAAMKTLSPEDRVRAAVELDITRTVKKD